MVVLMKAHFVAALGSFSYVNYRLYTQPNSELIAWKNVGDQAFRDLVPRNDAVIAAFGQSIQPSTKLHIMEQDAKMRYFFFEFDKSNPIMGSRTRIYEVGA